MTSTTTIPIADIIIGDRHRQDFGDLQALADSIAVEGLLQPIAVTESLELVAGERRLRAVSLLGHSHIAGHIVSVTSIIRGEFAENVIRKDFTMSERVGLAAAIKKQLRIEFGGDRRGKTRKKNEEPDKIGEHVPAGVETSEYVAGLVGFGNERSYRDAQSIIKTGAPELIAAVDAGQIPITTAAELLALSPEAQAETVKGGRLSVQTAAKLLRHRKAVERERVVPHFKITAILSGTYPCTIPACKRGVDAPFDNAGALGNHRFTAHGIRSTNHESIARQARRDRDREERKLEANPKPVVVSIKPNPNGPKVGPLDRGEREQLRKKAVVCIGLWAREFARTPSDVASALFEMCLSGLQPPKSAGHHVDPDAAFASTGA